MDDAQKQPQPPADADSPFHGVSSKRAEGIAALAMVAVFLACCFAWRLPADEPQPALPSDPKSISELDSRISSVRETGGPDSALEIVLDQATPTYEADVVADLGETTFRIAKNLQKFFPDVGSSKVRVTTRFVTQEPVLELTWLRADIMKVNNGGAVSFQELLNLSQSVTYLEPTSRWLVKDFCDDPLAETAETFCQRELANAIEAE